jgi:hypothetical protein
MRSFVSACLGLLFISAHCAWSIPSAAQDTASDHAAAESKKISGEILDHLDKKPSSAMDVGLLEIRQDVAAAFLSNKPDVFGRGNFYYLEAYYEPIIHVVLVSIAYKSKTSDQNELIAECRDDAELAISALTRPIPPGIGDLAGSQDELAALTCKASSFFLDIHDRELTSLTLTNPQWSICKSIKVLTKVESSDGKLHASCGKYLTEKEIGIKVD